MAKFVQVLMGQVFDVVIDMRAGSPTYKKWEGFSLSSENHFQLYIPRGFAHGFLTLTDDVVFLYKMSVQHDPDHEKQLHWLDPALAISWPVREGVRVSQKDSNEANYLV